MLTLGTSLMVDGSVSPMLSLSSTVSWERETVVCSSTEGSGACWGGGGGKRTFQTIRIAAESPMAISVFLSMLVIQTVRSLMFRNRVNSSGMKRMTFEKPCSRQHPAPKQSMVCQGFLSIFGTTWEKTAGGLGHGRYQITVSPDQPQSQRKNHSL